MRTKHWSMLDTKQWSINEYLWSIIQSIRHSDNHLVRQSIVQVLSWQSIGSFNGGSIGQSSRQPAITNEHVRTDSPRGRRPVLCPPTALQWAWPVGREANVPRQTYNCLSGVGSEEVMSSVRLFRRRRGYKHKFYFPLFSVAFLPCFTIVLCGIDVSQPGGTWMQFKIEDILIYPITSLLYLSLLYLRQL